MRWFVLVVLVACTGEQGAVVDCLGYDLDADVPGFEWETHCVIDAQSDIGEVELFDPSEFRCEQVDAVRNGHDVTVEVVWAPCE